MQQNGKERKHILGGLLDVDVVDAHARTADDSHLLGSLDDRRIHLNMTEQNGGGKEYYNQIICVAGTQGYDQLTLVALLTTSASYSPMILTSSASGMVFLKSTTWPLSLKMLMQTWQYG